MKVAELIDQLQSYSGEDEVRIIDTDNVDYPIRKVDSNGVDTVLVEFSYDGDDADD